MTAAKNLLIVEDDPALLRGLTDNFEQAGYNVATATDGESGLAQALTAPPDVMLLDIMLPQVNGYEVCHRIRSAKHRFPILMLTAKGQEDEVVRGLELGADDYVTKPFSIRELLARVNRFCVRDRDGIKQQIELGDAVLDLVSHTLSRQGEAVPLTAKEFQLLEFFVSRPHRALTRKEIMNHVWGRTIVVSGRSVDRCVATLRSKLEPNPDSPRFIHTIRSVGYRFELDSAGDAEPR